VLLQIYVPDLKFQKIRYSNGLIILVYFLNKYVKTQDDYAEKQRTYNKDVISGFNIFRLHPSCHSYNRTQVNISEPITEIMYLKYSLTIDLFLCLKT